MVSSQAHNLIKVVRFNLLQMLYLGSLLLFSTVLLAPPHMKKLYLAIVTIVVLFICVIDLSFIWATLKILSISNWELLFIVTIFLLGLWSLVLMGSSEFEIIVLIILLLLGSIFIVCTNQLVIIYLAIELQTFSLFVLMAKNKKSLKSAEGALKYFVLGAISSGIYLLGLSLISYEGAFMTLGDLGLFWSYDSSLIQGGILLVLLSLCFKLGLAPLHFWVADIYEASSWGVIAIISTIAKLTIIIILSKINLNIDILINLVVISFIVGALSSMGQTKLKRLLGYSGVTHMGFILITLIIGCISGLESLLVYLFIYFSIIFGILSLSFLNKSSAENYLISLSKNHSNNKLLAFSWAVLFLSVAGIPPLSGFLAKWIVIVLMVDNNYIWTSILAVLLSALAAGYYLRIVKVNYFQKQSSYLVWSNILENKEPMSNGATVIVGINLYVSLFLLLNPQPLFLGVLFSFI